MSVTEVVRNMVAGSVVHQQKTSKWNLLAQSLCDGTPELERATPAVGQADDVLAYPPSAG
jgi:hypothetical protein